MAYLDLFLQLDIFSSYKSWSKNNTSFGKSMTFYMLLSKSFGIDCDHIRK